MFMREFLFFAVFTGVIGSTVVANASPLPKVTQQAAASQAKNMQREAKAAAEKGSILWKAGKLEEALKSYDRAVGLNPQNALYWRERGRVYMDKEDYEKALSDLNAALRLAPRDDALFYRGRTRYLKDDYVGALKDLTPCVILWPDNADNWKERARTYWGLRQYDLAIADYNKSISLKQSADDYKERGDCHYAFKEVGAALSDYSNAISLDPKNKDLYESRAAVYQVENYWKPAIADRTRVIELDPTACSYASRAETYLCFGDATRALADAEKAVSLKGDDCSEHYIVYAETLSTLGDMKKVPALCATAAERLKKEKDTEKLEEWFTQSARIKLLQGKPEEALADCNEVLKIDVSDSEGLRYRSRAYAALKQWDKALEDMDKVISDSPKWASADYVQRAMICDALADTTRAQADRETAKTLERDGNNLIPPSTTRNETATVRTTAAVSANGIGMSANSEPAFGPYMADVQRRIKRAWFPPTGNETKRVTVTFRIHRNGEMSNQSLDKSSGAAIADQAALLAVKNAAPFRPLPAGAPDVVDIQFTFDYNVFSGSGGGVFVPIPAAAAKKPPAQVSVSDKTPPPNPIQLLVDQYKTNIKQSDTADNHYRLAEAYRRVGRIDDAIAEFKKTVAIDPKYEPARKILASMDAWKD